MDKSFSEIPEIYRLFAQNLPNTSIIMFDHDMRYILGEDAVMRRAIGDVDTIIGKLPHEVLPPHSLNFILPIYQRILSGESFSFERSTPAFSYQAYASPLKDDAGKIIGGMILSHDVTEAKRTEAALLASEARFHSLVDLAPVGIIQTDNNGKRVFCNNRWCEMAGVSLEQALNDHQFQTIHPDDLEVASGAWIKMMETHLPFENTTFRYLRPDGISIWVSGSGTPLYDGQGAITGYLGVVTNIDEQVRTQAALRESETRYRSVVNAMSEGVVLQAQDGTIQACNPSAERIVGLTADQMMGRTSLDPIWRAVHEDGSPFPGETHPAVITLRTGKPLSNIIMGIHKADSSLTWMSVNSRPILTNGNDLPSSVVVTFIDITEIRGAQEKLRQERDLLRTLIDNTPDYIFLKGTDERFILSNAAHTGAAGKIASEDMVGKTAFEVFSPELAVQFHGDDQELIKSGEALVNAEREIVDAEGQCKTVLTTKIPWRGLDGKILGLIGITRDVTKRKTLENSLRQNAERLRLITDNIQDLVTQNDVKGKLVFVSPSVRTMLGYEPDSLLGSSSTELIHPDDRLLITETLQTAIETRTRHFTVECRLRHSEGYYVWIEATANFIVDEQSNFTGGVFVARDITERKLLQTMTLEQEKLQTALEKELELSILKTRMMQRIAHEFRTPLTVIQTSIWTLTKYLDRLTSEQRALKVDMIVRQIMTITDMLDQISLVINGDFKPDVVYRESTDVGAVIRQVAVDLENQYNRPGKFVLDLHHGIVISADVEILESAVLHIMRNAVRFSEASTVVKVSLVQLENGIELRVTDSGIGILLEELPRIFEPFFRGSNINEVGGLGVGLTIARAAIEAHNGILKVESVPKQGTTVIVRIPQ